MARLRSDWQGTSGTTVNIGFFDVFGTPASGSCREEGVGRAQRLRRFAAMVCSQVCGLSTYYPSYQYSVGDSLLSIHGSEEKLIETVSTHAIPLYAGLESERVRTHYDSYLSVRERQAVESYVHEPYPNTRVIRSNSGMYVPEGATRETFSIRFKEGHSSRVLEINHPAGLLQAVNLLYTTSLGRGCIGDGSYCVCNKCKRWADMESFYRRPVLYREGEGQLTNSVLCFSCALEVRIEKGRFLTCVGCNNVVVESETTHHTVNSGPLPFTKYLCPACDATYEVCSTCGRLKNKGRDCRGCERTRQRENEVATMWIPSKCKWEKNFSILLPDGTKRESDTFLSITRTQGEVTNEGIDEIASLLRREGCYINFTSESNKEGERGIPCDVTQDISFVHGKGFPSIAKKIESFYYRHGQDKPSKEILQRIGEIASQNTPKEDTTLYYALTREFDRPREFYCHGESCWWSQKPTAFCYMKRYGGFIIAGVDETRTDGSDAFSDLDPDTDCASRGMVFPLATDGKAYYLHEWDYTDPWNPCAYFLFNVYGMDGYVSMAKALGEMVGMEGVERINISPLHPELWINGRISFSGELTSSFGYLLYPKDSELPPSLYPNNKYRHLSLIPSGMRRIERKCHCG